MAVPRDPVRARRRLRRQGTACALALLALTTPAAARAADASVGTSGTSFAPPSVDVGVGEKVTITNSNGGVFNHSLVWEDGAPGVATASTGHWSTERTFTQAGDYRFYCQVHGAVGGVGMSGVVHVGTTSTPPPPPPPPPDPYPPPTTDPYPPAPAPPAPPTPVNGPITLPDDRPPAVTATVTSAQRRRVAFKIALGEPARVTVTIERGTRVLARRPYGSRAKGTWGFHVDAGFGQGRLLLRVVAVDRAGNRTVRLAHVVVT